MRCLKLLTGDVHSSSNNRKKRNPHQETISCPSPNAAARHFCSGAGSCCSGLGSSRVTTRNRRSPSDRAGAARIEAVPEEHRHGTWHPSPRTCCLRARGDPRRLSPGQKLHIGGFLRTGALGGALAPQLGLGQRCPRGMRGELGRERSSAWVKLEKEQKWFCAHDK